MVVSTLSGRAAAVLVAIGHLAVIAEAQAGSGSQQSCFPHQRPRLREEGERILITEVFESITHLPHLDVALMYSVCLMESE